MKPISKKYIGGTQACSTYLPFAINKVKLVDKWRKNKAVASKGYSFSNGVEIKCTATKKLLSIQIQASLGGLVFIGINESQIIETFVTDTFTHQHFSRAVVVNSLPHWVSGMPDLDNTGDPIPGTMYDWRSDFNNVFAGIGIRYSMPFYDKESYTRYFGFTYFQSTIPHIMDKSGSILGIGPEGSESVACCVYSGYAVGVDERGLLKYWPIGDTADFNILQLDLPNWIGPEVVLETYPESGVFITGYHGWLDGESGIEWKFNSTGDRLIGIAREIVNHGWGDLYSGTAPILGTDDGFTTKHFWRSRPHAIIVALNPSVSENGTLSFSPTVSDAGFNYGLMAVDWYYLDNPHESNPELQKPESDIISYTFMDSYKIGTTIRYRLSFITDRVGVAGDDLFHDSFNISIYDDPNDEWPINQDYYLLWYGRIHGIDLRYHTYSYSGNGNSNFPRPYEGDEISYASGFDDNVYKHQIGNITNSDALFDFDTGVNKYEGSEIEGMVTPYFSAIARTCQYAAYGHGSSCAAIDNGVKKFAYMSFTPSNTGEYYDTIQIDDKIYTHQEVFESLGFTQTTGVGGDINGLYHIFGVFT